MSCPRRPLLPGMVHRGDEVVVLRAVNRNRQNAGLEPAAMEARRCSVSLSQGLISVRLGPISLGPYLR